MKDICLVKHFIQQSMCVFHKQKNYNKLTPESIVKGFQGHFCVQSGILSMCILLLWSCGQDASSCTGIEKQALYQSCTEERNFTLKFLAGHQLRVDFYLFISHELPVRFSVSQSQVWFEIQMTANILTLQYTYGCRMTLHLWVCDNIAPVGGWWHYPCRCVGIVPVGGW